MIAVIDNYDSFVFNLVQALGSMGEEIKVFRNDAIDVEGLKSMRPDRWNSSRISDVMRNPLRTKKTSTPRNPPGIQARSAW